MDIHTHQELLDIVTSEYLHKECNFSYTEWDGDAEDEQVSEFRGTLTEVLLTDNEFDEKDLFLRIRSEEEEWELLLEVPAEEADLATFVNHALQIFGTESEVTLSR